MNKDSNIGETGVKSIRIGGFRIADLGMVEYAHAKTQLPLAIDMERQNRINSVVAGAPKQRVAYLRSRIKESEENIERINRSRNQQSTLISDYKGEIALCRYRDKAIVAETDEAKIRELKKKFPPYNVEAMETQIKQSGEGIARCDAVISTEHESIKEMRGVMVLCQKRDTDLKNLGVRLATVGE